MKIWKKLLQVDRVHLEVIGNTSRYIHTHCGCAIAFLDLSIQAFRSQKEKQEDTIKRPQQNV